MKKNIAERVSDLIAGVVEESGCILWDVEYIKEGTEWILRITIDKDEGVDINDCEAVHRAVDPILDEADPIETSYRLEVSSPGIERVLRTAAHIEASVGCEVELRLFAALDGKKTLRGILGGISGGELLLTVGEKNLEISMDKISKINTVFDF